MFLKYGYDLDRERDVLLDQAAPLSGKILEAGTGKGHFAAALARRGSLLQASMFRRKKAPSPDFI
jgi:SAM-dependent MidA family methyltransferase